MNRRFNNRKLLYILAVLGAILLVTFLIKIPREKATLRQRLTAFDTTSVNKIIIYPRITEGEPFEFIKNNGKWTIQQKGVVAEPQAGAVQNIFYEVLNIKPASLASVDKSKWKEFNLTDSLGIRLKFLNKNENVVSDVMIGKFTYKPSSNPYAGSRANNVEGTSFVRLYDEDEVYSVDGFLSLSFTGKFNDYRNKSFLRLKKEDVTKISFSFPSDSSFVLTKKDSTWYLGNKITDSLNTEKFLGSLSQLNGQEIANNYKPGIAPVYQIHIEGNNLLDLSVKCYRGVNYEDYILNSSLNPEVYFVSKRTGIFNQLFKPQSYFNRKESKKSD
jgi:hypothetical protein